MYGGSDYFYEIWWGGWLGLATEGEHKSDTMF